MAIDKVKKPGLIICPSSKELYLGCDPEMFFEKGGQIIGSERVLDGMQKSCEESDYLNYVVIDGVQLELNPPASYCREVLGSVIADTFAALVERLELFDGVSLNFEGVVHVPLAELESLSPRARELGCQPSFNIYKPKAAVDVKVARNMRSAAGHIHLGFTNSIFNPGVTPHDHRPRLVPILDVVLGNTCVLLDRNPLAARRREVYGRAGEFRLPKYGLEYRTLSNFWLRSYQLFSLVMGLARMSVGILQTTLETKLDLEKELLTAVDLELVERAINTNNIHLAKMTYKIFREFVAKRTEAYGAAGFFGIDVGSLDAFEYFLEKVEKHGLEHWFPEDPVSHWYKRSHVFHSERLRERGVIEARGGGYFWGRTHWIGAERFLAEDIPALWAKQEEYGAYDITELHREPADGPTL